MKDILMVDLVSQYQHIKNEMDPILEDCFLTGDYISGRYVDLFENNLAKYTGIKEVVGCGNGTDALKLAIFASDLPKGSKIIVPAFTYAAPVEMIAFLGHQIVFADVDSRDFNITLDHIKSVYTEDVKAIIAVHLFGKPCKDIKDIYQFCLENEIVLIEDNAQSLGAEKNITRNSIFTTSFYPTKNLGAYGDAGAVLCNDSDKASTIRKIASHGQSAKYIHDLIGINSRLDTIQAAILNIKLKYLDSYNTLRQKHAAYYQNRLNLDEVIELPEISQEHIFHLFTIKVKNGKRDLLAEFLKKHKIASVINYPMAAYKQKAYHQDIYLPNTEMLCNTALSIPVYPEISQAQLSYICDCIESFFKAA